MLRQFGALPTEERVRAMKGRDYLWCLANALVDREEELDRLCPGCRARALEARCPVCGREEAGGPEEIVNPAFDMERFEALRGGEGLA